MFFLIFYNKLRIPLPCNDWNFLSANGKNRKLCEEKNKQTESTSKEEKSVCIASNLLCTHSNWVDYRKSRRLIEITTTMQKTSSEIIFHKHGKTIIAQKEDVWFRQSNFWSQSVFVCFVQNVLFKILLFSENVTMTFCSIHWQHQTLHSIWSTEIIFFPKNTFHAFFSNFFFCSKYLPDRTMPNYLSLAYEAKISMGK